MKYAGIFIVATLLGACGGGSAEEVPAEGNDTLRNDPSPATDADWKRVDFPQVADNIRHDTLVIQVTFDMGDGSFVMVASNITETFEGLRLYRYTLLTDSNAQVLAHSSPAYDSWTMLPTFFRSPIDTTSYIVLANFGEKESWGQKLLELGSNGFRDLGFLDVALPERVPEDEGLVLKRRNAAPFAKLEMEAGIPSIRFTCDSLYLYDDQRGTTDQVIAAGRAAYRLAPEGLQLELDGERRPVKIPG